MLRRRKRAARAFAGGWPAQAWAQANGLGASKGSGCGQGDLLAPAGLGLGPCPPGIGPARPGFGPLAPIRGPAPGPRAAGPRPRVAPAQSPDRRPCGRGAPKGAQGECPTACPGDKASLRGEWPLAVIAARPFVVPGSHVRPCSVELVADDGRDLDDGICLGQARQVLFCPSVPPPTREGLRDRGGRGGAGEGGAGAREGGPGSWVLLFF